MNDHEKSHVLVVPTKLRNKAAKAGADGVEGRGATKGNLIGQNARRTQSRESAPNALDRVREAAKRDRHPWPEQRFDANTLGKNRMR